VNFDVLRVITIKNTLWQIVMLWGLVDVYCHFWGPFTSEVWPIFYLV